MCWTCLPNDFKINRAEKDITVYKIVVIDKDTDLVWSPCKKEFPWSKNTIYHTDMNIHSMVNYEGYYCKKIGYFMQGDQGLHSFKGTPKAAVEQFIVRYTTINSLPKDCRIMECVIPERSYYSVGNYDEIISDALMPKALYAYENEEFKEIKCKGFNE